MGTIEDQEHRGGLEEEDLNQELETDI